MNRVTFLSPILPADKYLFTLNNKENRSMFKDVALVSLLLTLNGYWSIPVKKLNSKLSLNYFAIIKKYFRCLFNVPENAITFWMH